MNLAHDTTLLTCLANLSIFIDMLKNLLRSYASSSPYPSMSTNTNSTNVPSKPMPKSKPKKSKTEELNEDDSNKENIPPRYCYCNGSWTDDMIRCDNKLCSKQLFHYEHTRLGKVPVRWLCDYCEMKPLSKLKRYAEGE
jgi:hypothetical protein